ncbi:MAG: saccharopine dehydrogenase NADP-binding domain-containing protein [Bacteroidales bacterium]|nr:saccharopine dehydrogenase NADP-binding domain-containing protein [Bacteroidales bacterium]
MKIIVLGAGLVGGPIAIDLAQDSEFDVTVADINPAKFTTLPTNLGIKTIQQDLSNPEQVKELVKDYDFVVSAVPGFLGYRTLKATIEAKKNVVDIAFMPEDPSDLDAIAYDNNVVAIVDCGVAPGMSNILMGYAHHQLNETLDAIIYCGGLPEKRSWPWEYKAVFSPIDVVEEYTRPVRLIADGEEIIKPPLCDLEQIDFPGIGTLEAFLSDGLRSLVYTIKARNLQEKTLRYPGHIEKIKVLKASGFLEKEEITVNGNRIKAIDFTTDLLFKNWKLDINEHDFTLMKIIVEGIKDHKRVKYTFEMLDRYDEATKTHSMARTTGYTATSVIRLLKRGIFKEKGLIFPEFLGMDENFVLALIDELKKKNIHYTMKMEEK